MVIYLLLTDWKVGHIRSVSIPVPRMKGLNHWAELVSELTLSMILFSFSPAESSRYSGVFTEFSQTHAEERVPQLPNRPALSLLLQACDNANRRVAIIR